jgi:hypothetical protein
MYHLPGQCLQACAELDRSTPPQISYLSFSNWRGETESHTTMTPLSNRKQTETHLYLKCYCGFSKRTAVIWLLT